MSGEISSKIVRVMCHTKNVMALIGYANLGAAAGRSGTDSPREVRFPDRMILIFLRLQYKSRCGLLDRNPSKRKAFP